MGCPKLTYFENLPTLKVAYSNNLEVQKPAREVFNFNRKSSAGTYRYGLNGMEKDNEIKGNGNSYTTHFRQYNPRLGRWLSLDPLFSSFPWQSPYVGFDNNPIYYKDPKGSNSKPSEKSKMLYGVETTRAERRYNRKYNRYSRRQNRRGNPLFQEGASNEISDGQSLNLAKQADFESSRGFFGRVRSNSNYVRRRYGRVSSNKFNNTLGRNMPLHPYQTPPTRSEEEPPPAEPLEINSGFSDVNRFGTAIRSSNPDASSGTISIDYNVSEEGDGAPGTIVISVVNSDDVVKVSTVQTRSMNGSGTITVTVPLTPGAGENIRFTQTGDYNTYKSITYP